MYLEPEIKIQEKVRLNLLVTCFMPISGDGGARRNENELRVTKKQTKYLAVLN